MLGIPELLGFEISPYGVEVELPGEVLRIKASRFKKEFERLNSIHSLLFRYTYTALTQLAQSSVCGRYHTVEQRLCRWLLMAHDRTEGDELLPHAGDPRRHDRRAASDGEHRCRGHCRKPV